MIAFLLDVLLAFVVCAGLGVALAGLLMAMSRLIAWAVRLGNRSGRPPEFPKGTE